MQISFHIQSRLLLCIVCLTALGRHNELLCVVSSPHHWRQKCIPLLNNVDMSACHASSMTCDPSRLSAALRPPS